MNEKGNNNILNTLHKIWMISIVVALGVISFLGIRMYDSIRDLTAGLADLPNYYVRLERYMSDREREKEYRKQGEVLLSDINKKLDRLIEKSIIDGRK